MPNRKARPPLVGRLKNVEERLKDGFRLIATRGGLSEQQVQLLEAKLLHDKYEGYSTHIRDSAKRAHSALWAHDWLPILAHLVLVLKPDQALRDERYRLVIFEPLDEIRKQLLGQVEKK